MKESSVYNIQIESSTLHLQMIPRQATETLNRLARGFPIVAITGPRQSGKTTLAKWVFKDKPYVSLENPDEREFAKTDPKRFLARFAKGAVLDEVQRCPELLSWLQSVVKMCAARTGQLLNLASLGADCGISGVTAKQWLSVLESSYVVMLLKPHHRNFGKRLVKSPKLYFLDVGLAAWLMGIRDAAGLEIHSARGALFETWAVGELYKDRLNRGESPQLYFWRDSTGNEVDVILETAAGLKSIELKSGSTFASDWLSGLSKWKQLSQEPQQASQLVYGGDESYERNGVEVWSWRECWKAGAKP